MIIRMARRRDLWKALILVLSIANSATSNADSFKATGVLDTARGGHTAILLSNGKVLLVGGGVASAEIYDQATGTFSNAGSDGALTLGETATLLPDGKVLLTGGGGIDSTGLSFVSSVASAELYNPVTETFSATGSLRIGRQEHTATLLPNGKVLVVGGLNDPEPLAAELYDPISGSFSITGSLGTARKDHTATLLPSGEVLVVGGFNISSGGVTATAELYNPATGTFRPTGSLRTARQLHTATLLPNGKVLIAGGLGNTASSYLASAELYDPTTGTFSPTGSLGSARAWHAATLLLNGKVLVTGGDAENGETIASAELYDPATGSFSPIDSLRAARERHTSTLLPDGEVLIAGGFVDTPISPTSFSNKALDSAELYRLSDSGGGAADWIFLLLPFGSLVMQRLRIVSAQAR